MSNDNSNITPVEGKNNQIVIYTSADGKVNLEVQMDANTVWLTQQQIAQLYGKAVSTINEHLRNIFEEGELDQQVVIRKFRITTQHGAIQGKTQTNDVMCYNLDAILAVGFRVRYKQGTLFRQWAIERLKNYIVKGFDIDSERLWFDRLTNRYIEPDQPISA